MKRLFTAVLIAASVLAAPLSAQQTTTVAQLTAQGKVLLSSHMVDVTDQVFLIMGTVEGGPEFICITRFRAGSSYDQCRKFE